VEWVPSAKASGLSLLLVRSIVVAITLEINQARTSAGSTWRMWQRRLPASEQVAEGEHEWGRGPAVEVEYTSRPDSYHDPSLFHIHPTSLVRLAPIDWLL
jgi:hypothetical protein